MKRGQFNKLFPNHFDFGASLRKPYGVSSFNRLVRQYKASARRRGLEYSLSDDELKKITQSNCTYCNLPPSHTITDKTSNGAYTYTGVDRIDPTIGYTLSNCAPCCKFCNRAKSDMTQKEWDTYVHRLINNFKSREEVEAYAVRTNGVFT